MKQKIFILLFVIFLLPGLSTCSSQNAMDGQNSETIGEGKSEEIQSASSIEDLPVKTDKSSNEDKQQNNLQEEEKVDQNQFYITTGETVFTAVFSDNSSAEAFKNMLAEEPLTVDMHDYGSFEKVGEIGSTLPRNDEQITTEPGDVILYLGTSITIYYDTNSWNFTRLGKIQDVTKEDLLAALGDGAVTVTFSLEKSE